MSLIPPRDIRVQPYFGFRNAQRLIVDARVLRGSPPKFDLSGGWRTFRTMLRLYNSHEVAEHPVTASSANAPRAAPTAVRLPFSIIAVFLS